MKISIYEQYGIFDAGKQKNIERILASLEQITDAEITLDFCNCLIDYPATSQLLDKVVGELMEQQGRKSIVVLSDLTVNNEPLILSLLVWGSKIFDFGEISRTSSAEEFRKILEERLHPAGISLSIRLIKDDGSVFKEFIYE